MSPFLTFTSIKYTHNNNTNNKKSIETHKSLKELRLARFELTIKVHLRLRSRFLEAELVREVGVAQQQRRLELRPRDLWTRTTAMLPNSRIQLSRTK
jgi:hypothetical protein